MNPGAEEESGAGTEGRARPLPDVGEGAPRDLVRIEAVADRVATEPSGRIAGLDVARALAFAGMVAVNYRVVLDPLFAQQDPAWLSRGFAEITGRAAALFVILAGAGTTLMMRASGGDAAREPFLRSVLRAAAWTLALGVALAFAGFHAWSDSELARDFVDLGLRERFHHYRAHLAEAGRTLAASGLGLLAGLFVLRLLAERLVPGPRLRLLARAALLAGLGYAWYPIWNGDILHYYAVFLAVGALVVGWRARWIGLLVLAVAGGAAFWQLREDFRADWAMLVLSYERFWEPRSLVRNLLFNGWHPVLPWLAFFLVGMVLGRGRLTSPRFAAALVLGGSLLAVAGRQGALEADALLDAREVTRLAEAFPLAPAELAPGERTSDRAVLDADGRSPRLALRVGLDVVPAVDREHAADEITDARRLRRYLRATQDRHAFRALDLALRPRDPDRSEAGLEVVLRLGEDPSRPLAPGARERFAAAARGFAAWMGDRAEPPFGLDEDAALLGSGSTWPGTLTHLRVQRLAPILAADGSLRFDTAESVFIERERALALDRGELRLHRLTHGKSWPNPSPFFLIGATGSALALIGLCLLVTHSRAGRRLGRPLEIAGRMALSLYVAHIVIGLGILDLAGKSSGEDLPFITLAVLACVWVGVSGACAWQALFGLGPLERLLRWLAR